MRPAFEHGEAAELPSKPDHASHDDIWNLSPLEQVSQWLVHQFNEADAHGEIISRDTAETIAGLLESHLPPDAELARLSQGDDYDTEAALDECISLHLRQWNVPQIYGWLDRLEIWIEAQSSD